MTKRHSIAPLPRPGSEVPCPHEGCGRISRLDRVYEEKGSDGVHYFAYDCYKGSGARALPGNHSSGLELRYDCAKCEEPHMNHLRVDSPEYGEYLVCPSLLMLVSFQLSAAKLNHTLIAYN